MATFTIPSATDETKSYTVTLGPRSTACTCPDWTNRRGPGCAQEGTDCKHIKQARQEQAERLALIAGTVEDHQLQPLIEKHTAAQNWPVVLACLAEQWDRWELARSPQPVTAPSYDRVLVKARAWGREQKDARLRTIFA